MKLGDMPAFPGPNYPTQDNPHGFNGMTYRQWLAGMAMQGIAAMGGPHGHVDGGGDERVIVAVAVRIADALIKELEKNG